jgi:hypothetical protein
MRVTTAAGPWQLPASYLHIAALQNEYAGREAVEHEQAPARKQA